MEKERKARNKKLSMEDYLECFDNRHFEVLTYNQLNQIIAIHGFKLCKNELKKELLEAVRTIDLMDFRRSTIQNDDVSPSFLTLNEVIRDLKDLKWEECHVSSLITQGVASTHNNAIVHVKPKKKKTKLRSVAATASSVASTSTDMVLAKGKRTKRAKRELVVGNDECSDYAGAIVVAGGTTNTTTRTSFFF